MKLHRPLFSGSALALMVGSPFLCEAQVAPSAGQLPSGEPAEIIVTAQKRQQQLNDVGITIATASGNQLKAVGVTEIADLAKVVPGFTEATTFNGFPVFSLRGVSFNAAQLSAPPAVATYLDEAPLPYTASTSSIFLDVERVEVLKGPQGTLFGQNSTGGSINFIAAKPTDHFEAALRTELNNFGETSWEGHVSGPLTDTLKARLAASIDEGGAWQRGYFLSNRKNGSANNLIGRLLVDWEPTDGIRFHLNVNGSRDHGEAQQPQIAIVAPSNPAAAAPGLLTYPLPNDDRDAEISRGFDTHKKNSNLQFALRSEFDLAPQLTLTSITDYVRTRIQDPIQLDGTALDTLHGLYGGKISSFSQELRISGQSWGNKLNYVAGVNYQKDRFSEFAVTHYQTFTGLPAGAVLRIDNHLTNSAEAGFANAEYQFIPKLSLTAGLRYTHSKQTMTGCTEDGGNGIAAGLFSFLANNIYRAAAGLPPTDAFVAGGCVTINDTGPNPDYLPVSSNLEQSQSNLSWRAGLNYKPAAGWLVYGLVSRGYKSGQFPVQDAVFQSQARPLRQEELTAYEIGVKASFWDRRVQVNAALFYYDYLNKQFFTYVPVPPIGTATTLVNIPKSRAKGFDVDLTARPFRGLVLRGALTYVNTRIGKYQGFDFSSKPTDFTGSEFNFAPPVSATLDAEYRAAVSSSLQGYFGTNLTYNARTFADLGETPQNFIPSFVEVGLRVGVESRAGWTAGLFVRNLTNNYHWNSVAPGGDNYIKFAARPRTVGGSLSVKF